MSRLSAALSAEVSNAFAAELRSRTSWGEEPCLYTIRMHSGHCQLDPSPMPRSWWADGPLWEVLIKIAETAADVTGIPGTRRRPDTYGAAVRFEGNSVPRDPFDLAQFRHADTDAMAHGARPGQDLAAVRILIGADRTGITYHSRQVQGQPTVRSAIVMPAGRPGQSGAITAAIRRLTAVVTGVPLPSEEPWTEPGK